MSDIPTELTPEETAQFEAQTTDPIQGDTQPAQEQQPEPAPEVEKPQEATPEAANEPEAAQETKTVPLAALHEERTRRKGLDKENRELRERLARLEGRFEGSQPAEQPKQAPTVDTQPLEILQDVAEWKRQQVAQQEAQAQMGQFTAQVNRYEQEFASQNPDFGDALQHLLQVRRNELVAAGIPFEEGERYIQQEGLAIAARALEEGVNPAERFYAIAKARGYQKAAPAAQEAQPDASSAALLRAAEKLEKVARGQAASKSLSSAGGAGNTPLTAESANVMSLSELARLSDESWERMWN